VKSSSPGPAVQSVTVGTPIPVADNNGDTWMPAWTRDGSLFSAANDTRGFHAISASANVMFSEIIGADPRALTGRTVNVMSDYRYHLEEQPDGCMWKTSGCLALDGALYLVVARHTYGEKSGDPLRRQTARDASIIRSLNAGRTWLRAAQDNEDAPMFPGSRFATPYFVNYGQEGREAVADASDLYVYAHANNGFWDSGDDVILGRVRRSHLPRLQGGDWQFFTGGEGRADASWSPDVNAAQPVLARKGRLGMSGATYLPAQKCYFLIGWYYPAGGGKMPEAYLETRWDFYTAPHPWGPWTPIGSHTWRPEGFYCPGICPKFTSPDGKTIHAVTAGDWNNPDVYRLTLVPLTLD
jgi:hypothetical protein